MINEKDIFELTDSYICDFISKKSPDLFKRYNINKAFLTRDTSSWTKDINFILVLEIVKNLKVDNDAAERSVKLMNDFNNVLTKDEKQKQYLLPIIKEYRKIFLNA